MQAKTIWIINQYASTPDTGMGGRHYYLAKELAKQGHKVYLVASSYSHLLRKPPEIELPYHTQSIDDINFVWVKVPYYKNAHSKKRIINWFWFAWKLRGLVNIIPAQPDAILYSSPSLIGFLGAKYLSNVYKQARLVFEVRDIWPLTLIELGKYSTDHPFIRLLQWIEYKAYKDADRVVSNLKNAVEHMISHGMDEKKFSWVPNGFSLDEINFRQNLPGKIISQLPKDKFIIGYTGTLGVANALESFIGAAVKLKDQHNIVFVLVGDGKEKSRLKSLVFEQRLDNVLFIDPIHKTQVQSMLTMFDACFIGWKPNTLYKFGIAANKIAEYLISGKPIVHAYSGSCDPIVDAKAGITVKSGDSQAMADAILSLYNMTQNERELMGIYGKKYALANYDYRILAEKLADVLIA